MIEVEGLTKRFDGVLAVDNLSFEVQQGKVFGLLGPNGAGKTTTVRMLSCLIAPTAGQASVAGFRVGIDDTEIRQRVGILTEVPGLYERLSAGKNLEIYASLYGVTDIAGQVEKYLKMLDLWDRKEESVGGFSKGMKQKLAIARSLIHEPQVLFLDEPTAALDPQMAKVVRDFIEVLKSQGRTIFLCTHNLDEAERLCDRIAVLNTRLIALDTPEALRRQLFGRQTVVHLNHVGQAMVEAVRTLDFVGEVRQVDNALLIGLSDPEAQNPAIVHRLVEAGAEIQFVTELKHSLEDVYLTLLEEDRGAGNESTG